MKSTNKYSLKTLVLIVLFNSACTVGTWEIPTETEIPCTTQDDCPSGWVCDQEINQCTTGCEVIGAPTQMSATIGGGQILLTWSEKSTNAASFEIEVEADGNSQDPLAVSGELNRTIHNGAQGDTTYRYRMRALRDVCFSEWTDWVEISSLCGDHFWGPGESCDDDNNDNTDSCPNGEGGTCSTARCGDGFVFEGHEECDDGNIAPGDGCNIT